MVSITLQTASLAPRARLGSLASGNLACQLAGPRPAVAGLRSCRGSGISRRSESTCLGHNREVWTATVTNELLSIVSLTWAMTSLSADQTAPRAERDPVAAYRVLRCLAGCWVGWFGFGCIHDPAFNVPSLLLRLSKLLLTPAQMHRADKNPIILLAFIEHAPIEHG